MIFLEPRHDNKFVTVSGIEKEGGSDQVDDDMIAVIGMIGGGMLLFLVVLLVYFLKCKKKN
jgi:hypothetical protein